VQCASNELTARIGPPDKFPIADDVQAVHVNGRLPETGEPDADDADRRKVRPRDSFVDPVQMLSP
jgi:hypothetical protein